MSPYHPSSLPLPFSSSSPVSLPSPFSSSLLPPSPSPPTSHLSLSPPLSPPLFSSPPPPTSPSQPNIPSHPPLPSHSSPLSSSPFSLSFPTAAVLKAIQSFPLETAPGPSGLRANHLKESVCCPSPSVANSTLTALSLLTSRIGSGLIPSSFAPFLCGASLLASRKKSGGLRPIAIGEVLRHLTSKCLSSLVLPQVKQLLPPYQVRVGCRNGLEALIHSLKIIQSSPSVPPNSKFCLQVDFLNAFNSIDREVMFQELSLWSPLGFSTAILFILISSLVLTPSSVAAVPTR